MEDIIIKSIRAYNEDLSIIKYSNLLPLDKISLITSKDWSDNIAALYSIILYLINHTKDIKGICKERQIATPKLNIKEWLRSVYPYKKGKQGITSTGFILNNKVIIKSPLTSKYVLNTLIDFYIGLKLNNLNINHPFFIETLGIFMDNKSESNNRMCIITKFQKSKNLKEMFDDIDFTVSDFISIFVQIIIALEAAQYQYKFCHYDLHTENILIVKSKPFYTFLYKDSIFVKSNFKPVICDFGMSSILDGTHYVGQEKLSNFGVHKHITAGYDIYTFLLFCKECVGDDSKFSNIIMWLFTFYNQQPLGLNYIDNLKYTGWYTPLDFLNFLRQNLACIMTQHFSFEDRRILTHGINYISPYLYVQKLCYKNIIFDIKNPINEGFLVYFISCRNQLLINNIVPVENFHESDINVMIQKDVVMLNEYLLQKRTRRVLSVVYILYYLIKQLRFDSIKGYHSWILKVDDSMFIDQFFNIENDKIQRNIKLLEYYNKQSN